VCERERGDREFMLCRPLLRAGQLEPVHGLPQMFDRHSDRIGAHALAVVRASALFDPTLQLLQALKPLHLKPSRNGSASDSKAWAMPC